MKRKNFPGRRMMRQVEADIRAEGTHRGFTAEEMNRINHAREQRTKRGRS